MEILNYIQAFRDYLNSQSELTHFSYFVLMLSIVMLSSIWSILGYIIFTYVIEQYKLEVKYPKISLYFKTYKLLGSAYLIISSILCIVCLLLLITVSALLIYYS